ncbi:hypothetical protein KY338_05705 [Candidatus Woesearchaeota archaeon]|nr:hypothetical protein [Candidatus Woesearchaeota archaeon]MBW3006441.1 hypothetical protein [Candidatus Woesearchaeota archaeon]
MKIKEAYQTVKILAGLALATIAGCATQEEKRPEADQRAEQIYVLATDKGQSYTGDLRTAHRTHVMSVDTNTSMADICRQADTNHDRYITREESTVLEKKLGTWPGR